MCSQGDVDLLQCIKHRLQQQRTVQTRVMGMVSSHTPNTHPIRPHARTHARKDVRPEPTKAKHARAPQV